MKTDPVELKTLLLFQSFNSHLQYNCLISTNREVQLFKLSESAPAEKVERCADSCAESAVFYFSRDNNKIQRQKQKTKDKRQKTKDKRQKTKDKN